MINAFVHIYSGNDVPQNEAHQLDSIPATGDTIAFDSSSKFYLVLGVTRNYFDSAKFAVDLYVKATSQSEWIQSIK
ncbi:hypothetical protein EQG49_12655 [Periweissella cryptocerci]|uniref:Uncharacterized protein n=1 Tax=Periweissella cryptocerci TaxID=2506420 RepID=A0A4P6YWN5_9LACO|nr:hypothetical protein [Periweissella cryptocerci]QBO37248.1 hypothetical protein EQG49_12655 [Periweissella cryptocerci]